MTVELREIPPAPRRVAWRTAFGRYCALGLAAVLLAGGGGLASLLLWIADRGSHHATAELELDRDAVVAEGLVLRVEPAASWDGRRVELVSFRHELPGGGIEEGRSFAPAGLARVGAPIEIEYLADRPHLSRVLGGHVHVRRGWLAVAVGGVLLPGLGLLGVWLAAVLRLRQALRDGDAALAVPVAVRRVRWMVPAMLEVRFRFRDRHAAIREGRHWVRARSPLGQRLTERAPRPPEDAPRVLWRPGARLATPAEAAWWIERTGALPRLVAIHARDRPGLCRLVAAADFAPAQEASRALPPRARLG